MALKGRRINNFVELWCLVASRGVDIWVLSTSFQKSNIGWPQQPLKERVPDISKKLDFWWSIPQKGTGFDQFGLNSSYQVLLHEHFLYRSQNRSKSNLTIMIILTTNSAPDQSWSCGERSAECISSGKVHSLAAQHAQPQFAQFHPVQAKYAQTCPIQPNCLVMACPGYTG